MINNDNYKRKIGDSLNKRSEKNKIEVIIKVMRKDFTTQVFNLCRELKYMDISFIFEIQE